MIDFIKNIFRKKVKPFKTVKDSFPNFNNLDAKDQHCIQEYSDGQIDGRNDFLNGKEMCQTLNFPASHYARGYFETYDYLRRNKK